MSSAQQASIAISGYPRRRYHISTRHRVYGVLPVMEAVGWILTGAAIGSLAVVATAWALMRLTNIDDSSSASLAGANAEHDVMRAEQGDRRVAVSAHDANASSYGM
jgi:hypothetical protein